MSTPDNRHSERSFSQGFNYWRGGCQVGKEERVDSMTSSEIRDGQDYPGGSCTDPHPRHPET